MSGPRQLTPAELAALEQIAKASAPSLTPVPLWQRDPFTTGAKTTPEPYVAPSMRAPTTRERVGDAVRGVGSSLAALPPVQAALKLLAQAGPHLDEATYGQAKPGTGWSLGMMPDVPQKGTIRAYHGSPHKFDKFSMEKIGTGEGNQAYGHGLYFAENENIAKSYRDELSGARVVHVPEDDVGTLYGDAAKAWLEDGARRSDDPFAWAEQQMSIRLQQSQLTPYMRDVYQGTLDTLRKWRDAGVKVENGGATYEVAIKADPDTLLDWDAPLTQQPEPVRKALEQFGLKGDKLRRWQEITARLDEISNQRSTWHAQHPEARAEWDALVAERQKLSSDVAQSAPVPRLRPWFNAKGEDVYRGVAENVDREILERERQRIPTQVRQKDGYVEVLDQHGKFITNVFGSPVEADALQEAARRLGDPRNARLEVSADQLAAERLRAAGIPGLKYRDALSRNPMRQYDVRWDATGTKAEVFDPATGKAHRTFDSFKDADAWVVAHTTAPVTHNYVIWDDSLIEILRQYGLLGLLGGGLAAQQVRGFTPTQEAR